ASRWTWARHGDGDSGAEPGHPKFDSRRQNSPDLFGDADGHWAIGHADIQSEPGEHLFCEADHAGSGVDAFIQSGRIARHDQSWSCERAAGICKNADWIEAIDNADKVSWQ